MLIESGYASFNLRIDIFLKTGPRDDQKPISFLYDLDIMKSSIQKLTHIIANPSTEFRHRLIDGGGIPVNGDGKYNFITIFCVGVLWLS